MTRKIWKNLLAVGFLLLTSPWTLAQARSCLKQAEFDTLIDNPLLQPGVEELNLCISPLLSNVEDIQNVCLLFPDVKTIRFIHPHWFLESITHSALLFQQLSSLDLITGNFMPKPKALCGETHPDLPYDCLVKKLRITRDDFKTYHKQAQNYPLGTYLY